MAVCATLPVCGLECACNLSGKHLECYAHDYTSRFNRRTSTSRAEPCGRLLQRPPSHPGRLSLKTTRYGGRLCCVKWIDPYTKKGLPSSPLATFSREVGNAHLDLSPIRKAIQRLCRSICAHLYTDHAGVQVLAYVRALSEPMSPVDRASVPPGFKMSAASSTYTSGCAKCSIMSPMETTSYRVSDSGN